MTTDALELGDWLAEHLMGWEKGELGWLERVDDVTTRLHHEDYFSTGDGMLAVKSKMQERGYEWETWFNGLRYRAMFYRVIVPTLGIAFEIANSLPLAVALAAKAALEARLPTDPWPTRHTYTSGGNHVWGCEGCEIDGALEAKG